MNRNFLRAIVLFGGSALASYAGSVTLYPNSPGVSGVAGDPNDSAPGFGSGSFQSSPTAATSNKSEIYITPSALFAGPVKISDISSISYFTNKPGDYTTPDWSLYIYTAFTGSGDTGSFYHSRLTAEPYFTNSTTDAAGSWHLWSTNDPTNPLTFYDAKRNGGINGTYGDPTLATLQSGPESWPGASTYDYRNDTVLYFSLQTGTPWATNFTGLVDGLTINLNDGSVGTANLEASATPEPGSLALLFGGAVSLLALRRRK